MVTFQPGKFSPVVEVSQRSSGSPAAADVNFAGLEEVALTTLHVSLAAAKGSGATIDDPTPTTKIAKIIGYVLAARNIIEQLNYLGVYTRVSSVHRSSNGNFLEPLIRAYNFYGHFTLDDKVFVSRGLEFQHVAYLFFLRKYATAEVADGTRHTEISGSLDEIDLTFYSLSSDGDIAFTKLRPFKHYLLELVKSITDLDLLVDTKLPLLQECLDVSTEDALKVFLRKLRSVLPGFQPPDRNRSDSPTDQHKAAMKKLFNKDFSSDNDVIPNALFVRAVNNAYSLLRRVSLERNVRMRSIGFPKYEGGSASQLAELVDDVLVSSVSLSLVDSTAALAFTTSFGTLARYKSSPGILRDELLRELVSQSLIM